MIGPRVQVGLLGPLTIEADGNAIHLGASSTRRAFIYLALHPGRVVTADRLAHALWSDRPPVSVERAVHSLVYRLRQQLASGVDEVPIVRREPGYLLDIAPSDIDLHVFERRLDDAHALLGASPRAARDRLESALTLWRGEPLMDVAYESWALAEAQRICERYVAAREAVARCDIALGDVGRAIAELTGLTLAHPLRESLWALLWQALAQAGRYSEVVASHRRCSRLLHDEFGIESLRHLDDLAHELVHAD